MEKLVGEGEKFERIRRVTGYLSGDVSRFNNAKRAEEKDRVKHTGVKDVMACENGDASAKRTEEKGRAKQTDAKDVKACEKCDK